MINLRIVLHVARLQQNLPLTTQWSPGGDLWLVIQCSRNIFECSWAVFQIIELSSQMRPDTSLPLTFLIPTGQDCCEVEMKLFQHSTCTLQVLKTWSVFLLLLPLCLIILCFSNNGPGWPRLSRTSLIFILPPSYPLVTWKYPVLKWWVGGLKCSC